jgi:hypothetical protein
MLRGSGLRQAHRCAGLPFPKPEPTPCLPSAGRAGKRKSQPLKCATSSTVQRLALTTNAPGLSGGDPDFVGDGSEVGDQAGVRRINNRTAGVLRQEVIDLEQSALAAPGGIREPR